MQKMLIAEFGGGSELAIGYFSLLGRPFTGEAAGDLPELHFLFGCIHGITLMDKLSFTA
jgi:hypothetical protein